MKFKKLASLILLTLAATSSFSMSDGQAALLGIVIGSQLNRGYVQPQPQPYYGQETRVYQRPIIIQESQSNFYDSQLHGYCAGYQDEMYAQCIGNIKRIKMEDAYRRGLRGY